METLATIGYCLMGAGLAMLLLGTPLGRIFLLGFLWGLFGGRGRRRW